MMPTPSSHIAPAPPRCCVAAAAGLRARVAVVLMLMQLLLVPLVGAQQAVSVPKLGQYVTDTTGTLTQQQLQELDGRLRQIDQSTGSQVAVLMIPTLGGQDIASYSLAVAEQNQIGRKKLSDGVLLLIVKDDRQARVEVGYGLEGAIPDITAGRIIREYLGPKFRANDYFGGISDAIGILDKAIRGEQLPAPLTRQGDRDGQDNWLFALIAAFIAAQVARAFLGRLPAGIRGLGSGAVGGIVAWLLSAVVLVGGIGAVIGFVVGLISGGGGGGRYVGRGGGWGGPIIGSGGWGGGSSGGGFGGGGFSGGGGSFGGGGASGSW